MSETVIHIGKLRKVELLKDQTIEDFYKEKLAERGINELRVYDIDWHDAFMDEFNNEYFIIDNIIWKTFDHTKMDDHEDIIDLKENSDGTLSFIMKFYNGGTCLSELITDELLKLKKK